MAARTHGAMHPGARRERSMRRAHARAIRTASEDLVRHAELAGVTSLVWGVLTAIGASPATTPQSAAWWLIGYALPLGLALLVLSTLLQRRHWRATMVPV
jgi:hypothetical protein